MHKLARCVRFSVNPFLPQESAGRNSFASNPVGEGLSIFLELSVEVVGEVEGSTGFVVNVTDIDAEVRRSVVPIFADRIRTDFRAGEHIGIAAIAELLRSAWAALTGKFGDAAVSKLSLKLNPYRKIGIDSGDSRMIYFSEKFEFAATHKLWNEEFSEQRNFEVFGKCANPTGHGHNYVVEVAIKAPADKGFRIGDFECTVDEELIKVVDHKNLNVDVAAFAATIPTVENIAVFAWDKLADKFGEASLHCVTIWETDKTSCSYYGR